MLINMFRSLLWHDRPTQPVRFRHFFAKTGGQEFYWEWTFDLPGTEDTCVYEGDRDASEYPWATVRFDVTFTLEGNDPRTVGVMDFGYKPLDAPRTLVMCRVSQSLLTLLGDGNKLMPFLEMLGQEDAEHRIPSPEDRAHAFTADYAHLWVKHNPQDDLCALFAHYLITEPSHLASSNDAQKQAQKPGNP